MSQSIPRPPSVASTANTRPSVSDALYRETIHRNQIILDPTGRSISDDEDIQKLVATYILKRRGSPPLTDEEVHEVVDKAADLLDNAEEIASDLIETKAFPLKRSGIAEGRNVQWSTDPLPTNPTYPHQLTAPKPDRHYGYPLGRKFDWTDEHMAVIDHRTAQPYTQPTRDNVFPVLALEINSEATGGVLYVAGNQGVGSGAHIVASQRWLLRQAYPSKVLAATDAVAFVGDVSPRTGVFYIVWYSDKKARYVMSMIRIVSFMQGPDIQRCRDLMNNNIMEYASETRLRAIKETLSQLDPVPARWKKSRPASVVAEKPTPTR